VAVGLETGFGAGILVGGVEVCSSPTKGASNMTAVQKYQEAVKELTAAKLAFDPLGEEFVRIMVERAIQATEQMKTGIRLPNPRVGPRFTADGYEAALERIVRAWKELDRNYLLIPAKLRARVESPDSFKEPIPPENEEESKRKANQIAKNYKARARRLAGRVTHQGATR
jgi:hypothetical protein